MGHCQSNTLCRGTEVQLLVLLMDPGRSMPSDREAPISSRDAEIWLLLLDQQTQIRYPSTDEKFSGSLLHESFDSDLSGTIKMFFRVVPSFIYSEIMYVD